MQYFRYHKHIVWHYTVEEKWRQIRASGVIDVARGKVHARERPAAWFSARADYEPTAVKVLLDQHTGRRVTLTIEQTERLAGPLVRIGVDRARSAPHDWIAFQALSGCPRAEVRRLDGRARVMGGDPAEWYVSFAPVPASEWLHVEARDPNTKRWHPMTGAE